MVNPLLLRVVRRFYRPGIAMGLVLLAGTVGYRFIGGPAVSLVDCFYMTFITVSTIGYAEIIDMTGRPGARLFTVAIAAAGMAVMTYILSTATAFIVEGEMNLAWRRRNMQKRIAALRGHYIVCGVGRVGSNVAHELIKTERIFVAIEASQDQLSHVRERFPETMFLVGDASEDEMLAKAGIAHAAGVFAVTGEDSKNLVITLTAKQMNPNVRVVARCHEVSYFSKMQKVGADAIVSPDFTGGMRIVSSMIRPQVVSFLDEMLRTDDNVRVEEIVLPPDSSGGALGDIAPPSDAYVVLAVKRGARTLFNPGAAHAVIPGDAIVVMTTPAGRMTLEKRVSVD
jgi:voltage-gated potassium channel